MLGDFVSVAKSGDIAEGEVVAIDIAGNHVAVANVGGEFYAFDDTCTHRQCSLAEGELEDTTITCPCHGSQFDVTSGDLLTPPAAVPLQTYAVRLDGDAIQLEL